MIHTGIRILICKNDMVLDLGPGLDTEIHFWWVLHRVPREEDEKRPLTNSKSNLIYKDCNADVRQCLTFVSLCSLVLSVLGTLKVLCR